jgi:hypothetical protein
MTFTHYIALLIQWTESKPLILSKQSELMAVFGAYPDATDDDIIHRACDYLDFIGAFAMRAE